MLALCVVTLVAGSVPSHARWVENGAAICTAPATQKYPVIVSDGSWGAAITWQDYRTGAWDIYIQRADRHGAVQWTVDGVAVCTASGNQEYPVMVADGVGGAIVSWQDNRGADYDIFAQKIDASGDTLWTADGVAICTASYDQAEPQLISDGAGGAIITWHDYRGGSHADVYAQRIDAGGSVLWTTDGIAICTVAQNQHRPQLISDGAGGAIITWQDPRGENYADI